MDRDTKNLIKKLEERGYKVEKDFGPTIKRTVEIPEQMWARVLEIVHSRKILIKQAVTEMAGDWIEKWSGK